VGGHLVILSAGFHVTALSVPSTVHTSQNARQTAHASQLSIISEPLASVLVHSSPWLNTEHH